ncbi:peptide deformylase [Conexibacter sp. CPCC 206217]|uniref:peptide deformylase n=1 Tax=Conexibacter sp. CPCC 206217 TaxID=3064574 RepID=UPI00271EDBAE|nr:peptide deformylase [Conexibacter sp. CPCC 206217]MDO8210621.1 peptide deformylase [Conexibacter sp. CPCC 206217]
MSREQLRQWGDPILRMKTVEVTVFDGALRRLVERMSALMEGAAGAGLAAPQAGSAQRLFVYRLSEEAPVEVLVNPCLTWASDERLLGPEGCLSIPRVAVEVERAAAVTVVGCDARGVERTVTAEGPGAVVLQHELDHLDGILMLDRAAPAERRRAIRELRDQAFATR